MSFEVEMHQLVNPPLLPFMLFIKSVSSIKYLEVIIDQRLSWNAQLEKLMNKTRKLMWI